MSDIDIESLRVIAVLTARVCCVRNGDMTASNTEAAPVVFEGLLMAFTKVPTSQQYENYLECAAMEEMLHGESPLQASIKIMQDPAAVCGVKDGV